MAGSCQAQPVLRKGLLVHGFVQVHMPLDFRPFTFLLIIAYCWSLETTWSLYKETEGTGVSKCCKGCKCPGTVYACVFV
eukprot:scaffold197377_cov14-Tisochrysis_lutea.AAC.1